MRILAVDPGKTCGAVYTTIYNGELHIPATRWESVSWNNWARWFYLVDHWEPDVVICEDFKLFPHKRQQQTGSKFPTVKVIGALEMLCWSTGVEFVLQEPHLKEVYSTKRLKSFDLYIPGSKHRNDAMRHLLWYLYKGLSPNVLT